jgi:hypothetical protein
MPKKLRIEEVGLQAALQLRADINHKAIDEYTEAYKSLDRGMVPPLEVFEVQNPEPEMVNGRHKLTYSPCLVDGFHRLVAAQQAGFKEVPVVVKGKGTMSSAIWYALSVNQQHTALRRTHADKRKAVVQALESFPDKPDTKIAEQVGVHRDLVAAVKNETPGVKKAAPAKKLRRSTGSGKSTKSKKKSVTCRKQQSAPGNGAKPAASRRRRRPSAMRVCASGPWPRSMTRG